MPDLIETRLDLFAANLCCICYASPTCDGKGKADENCEIIAKLQRVIRFLTDNKRRVLLAAPSDFPTIVCLCGSTRFWREFQEWGLKETLAGKIVLSIGAASGTDDEHFGNLPREEYEAVKADLDQLHFRKIDLADEVLIINKGGYIGESTMNELNYARDTGKIIRFLEDWEGGSGD
jgi:hypothetical protein